MHAAAVPLARRDGESSPFIAVAYSSRASADDIAKAYDTALKPAACKLTGTEARAQGPRPRSSAAGPTFCRPRALDSESPCASVELDFTENY